MGKDIDMAAWAEAYASGRAAGGDALLKGYEAKTGKAAALTTAAAIANFKANVVSEKAMKKRTRKINAAGDAGMNAGMRDKGVTAYQNVPESEKAKASAGFGPIAVAINAARRTMPAKGADGVANLTNRAGHIVKAMIAKSKEIG